MPALKSTFIEEIRSTIDSTRFSVEDFDFDSDEYGELLRISFKYNDEYNYVLSEEEVIEEVTSGTNFNFTSRTQSKTVTKLYSHESPGDYKKTDKVELSGYGQVCNQILNWCQNLHKELSSESSVNSDIEGAKRAFKEQFEINVDDPNAKFSADEISHIKSKLDDLYNKFEELSKKYQISESELEKLNSEIDRMKESVSSYKKGIWAKITQNKITDLIFSLLKSKESRELIVESIRRIGS